MPQTPRQGEETGRPESCSDKEIASGTERGDDPEKKTGEWEEPLSAYTMPGIALGTEDTTRTKKMCLS